MKSAPAVDSGSPIFAPVCSITTTKRRRFFWAAWWSGPPTRVPFRKPDASDGAADSAEAALAAAEKRAGIRLVLVDPLWARAWMRLLRGQDAFPSIASREPASARRREPTGERGAGTSGANGANEASIWSLLGVARDVSPDALKAAYRQKVLDLHPDRGGDAVALRRVIAAYEEAERRLRRPRPKGK